MQLARVVGTVVSTNKDSRLRGRALLVLQPVDPSRQPQGPELVAVDSVGAGVGEEVFFVRGREAALPFRPDTVPTDAAVTGICDHWQSEPLPATAATPASAARRSRRSRKP